LWFGTSQKTLLLIVCEIEAYADNWVA